MSCSYVAVLQSFPFIFNYTQLKFRIATQDQFLIQKILTESSW